MRPYQVDHVAESAQSPDVPLILAHALAVNLLVDKSAFLLLDGATVEPERLQARALATIFNALCLGRGARELSVPSRVWSGVCHDCPAPTS